jgi:hypothetical protein
MTIKDDESSIEASLKLFISSHQKGCTEFEVLIEYDTMHGRMIICRI